MAAAVAGDVHGMMPASAETRSGHAGDVSRRRVCRVPEERDQSKGNGEVAERARRREHRERGRGDSCGDDVAVVGCRGGVLGPGWGGLRREKIVKGERGT